MAQTCVFLFPLSFRKLLIQDINDLKYQQEEAKKALGHGENQPGKEEDPVMLRIALGYILSKAICVQFCRQ